LELHFNDKKLVVELILSGRAEEALALLAGFYRIEAPQLVVGTVKRHRKVAAVYEGSSHTIYLASSDFLKDPFVILHEFYHHLRTSRGKHRGTEKYANQYALEFLSSV
jgi:hypothetical protein